MGWIWWWMGWMEGRGAEYLETDNLQRNLSRRIFINYTPQAIDLCQSLHHSLPLKSRMLFVCLFCLLYKIIPVLPPKAGQICIFQNFTCCPSAFFLPPSVSKERPRNVLLPFWQALFGMSGAWLVCFLLTYLDVLPTSPDEYGYQARTDINLDAVSSAEWFFMPYPGGYVNSTDQEMPRSSYWSKTLQNYFHLYCKKKKNK